MIVCSSCGTALEDDLRFCTECGTPNPMMSDEEATVVLGSASSKHGVGPAPLNYQSTTVQRDTGSNDATSQITAGGGETLPPPQHTAASNHSTLTIVVAVISTVLLIALGAIGSRFLMRDNSHSETTSDVTQSGPSPNATPQSTIQSPTQTPDNPPVSAPTLDVAKLRQEVIETLNGWAGAARAHDLDAQMSYYADRLDTYYFRTNVAVSYVRSSRAPAFERYASLDIQVDNISVTIDDSGTLATATFDKTYRFEGDKILEGSVQQRIILTSMNGRWLITSERDLKVYYTNR